MKSQCYFTHSSSEHHSTKLLPMINEYGMKGYGWYWVVMETLRDEDDYTLPLNDFTVMALQAKFRTLAEDVPDRGTVQGFLRFCVHASIFYLENDRFGSTTLTKQMAHMEKTIQARAEAGRKGGRAKQPALPSSENSTSNCLANDKQLLSKNKQMPSYKIREDEIRSDEILEEKSRSKDDTHTSKTAPQARVPYEDIAFEYNQICRSLPNVQEPKSWNTTRKRAVQARWKENDNIGYFVQLFTRVEASDFLSGRTEKGFRASFDWILKPANMQKIVEGNYDNRGGQRNVYDTIAEWANEEEHRG